ncbi:MAG: hypothetical protein ACFFCS_06195 [Candidatus Hodarchaeota archaeon]
MGELYPKELNQVKNILIEKEEIRQASLTTLLKINKTKLDKIVTQLEADGFLKKQKETYKGHQVNKIVVIKNSIFDEGDRITGENIMQDVKPSWSFMNESPCFFCNHLDTCSPDSVINYLNCPKLNSWITPTKQHENQ